MPAITQIEILNGKVAVSSKGESARPSTPTPARPEAEAGGRLQTLRVMRCQSCGALSYVEYDPDITHDYNCSNCHVANTL